MLCVEKKRNAQKLKHSKSSAVKRVHRIEYRRAQARMSALKRKLSAMSVIRPIRSEIECAHALLCLETSTGPVRFSGHFCDLSILK